MSVIDRGNRSSVEVDCFKMVTPLAGIFIIPGDCEHLYKVVSELCGNHTSSIDQVVHHYVVSPAVHADFGKYGSPVHGNAKVVFVARGAVMDHRPPHDIFGNVFTQTCTHVAAALATVSTDILRGWTELADFGKAEDAVSTEEVSEILKGMVEDGSLPPQFTRVGITGGKPVFARTSLAVARLEALQWWMTDQGKDLGIVNMAGKDNTVYLDGSFPKVSKRAIMAFAQKDTTGVSFRALTNIEILAILGYNIKAYPIWVSTHAMTSQTLAHSIPVPLAFAAVMAVARALTPNGDAKDQ